LFARARGSIDSGRRTRDEMAKYYGDIAKSAKGA